MKEYALKCWLHQLSFITSCLLVCILVAYMVFEFLLGKYEWLILHDPILDPFILPYT